MTMFDRLFRRRDPKAALKEVLGGAELPTFPDVVMRALELLRKDASLSQVAQVLCGDPGASTKLLSMVNSAAHSLRRPVKDVPQAAALLGRGRIEQTLLGMAVAEALPKKPIPGFDPKEFWRNASWRAAAARRFAQELHPSSASASYTAGLLQDMAMPILAGAVDGYSALVEQAQADGNALVALERKAHSWDHAEVAGWMCAEWSFPEELTAAISHHHMAANDNAAHAPTAVLLVAGLGDPDDQEARARVVSQAEQAHGMRAEATEQLLDEALDEASHISKLFAA